MLRCIVGDIVGCFDEKGNFKSMAVELLLHATANFTEDTIYIVALS